jgi:two-component system, sensor histidine kinase and response regulator
MPNERRFLSVYQSVTVMTCVFAAATTLSGCAVIHSLAATDSFMPHGYCLAWNPQLLAVFVVGNALVALSYYSIPAALWIFVRNRKDLAFNWMFRLFAAFIFLCGTTHLMKLWTIWSPNYWAEGLVDLVTGLISAYTAVALWPLIPKALAMRSPQQWEEANQRLQELLEQRNQADKALRESQRELQIARDEAVESSRFKSEFLASMSHEIRTPMNGILGMTEILLRSNLNDKQHGYATTVQEAGKSLLSVINDVLDFSKIEAGKLFLEVVDFEPIRLVESIADLLAEPARQKGLSLLTFIDPNISSAVHGDPGRLRQILMNLVGNAIKFSEHGEILIRASLEKKEESIDLIKFSVTDTGIGLTDEEISRLFRPFVQLAGSMTQSGTGLGLSISKRLVDLMNGEIGVHSVKGHGSTFWLSVPFERSMVAESGIRVTPDLSGVRVLVVDDEKTAREVLNDYLVSWGIRNDTAKNSQEALNFLRTAAEIDPYTIVVIDLMMPDINGLQLGKIIREDDILKNARIILVTAFDKPGTGEEAISLGFDAYLTKPIKQSQLLDCITGVLRESGAKELSSQAIRDAAQSRASVQLATRDELLLVVEDHRINQEVALLLLKAIGFEAHVANNGHQALELLQRIPYALVFMDCQMPELDGFETTRALRKIETRTGKHVPIIAMTAHVIEGSREQCLASGMDDYISKPIDSEQLQQLTDKWLPLSTVNGSPAAHIDSVSSPEQPIQQTYLSIDVHKMESKFGPNTSELINMFVREASSQLEKLKDTATTQDTAELLWCVHGLRGVCATVFALPMHKICGDIESAVREQDWKTISALIDQLVSEFDRVKKDTGTLQ